MRQIFLLLLLVAFPCKATWAQTLHPEKRFQVGLIGGKTIIGSYQRDAPWEGVGGGFVGADISYAFAKENPNFTVRLQPNFESFRYLTPSEPIGFGEVSYQITLNSLNLPILIQFAVPAGKWVSPFVEIGGNHGSRIKSYSESRIVRCGIAGCNESFYEGDIEIKNQKNNISLLAGIGAEFHWGVVRIPLSIRMSRGLSKYSLQGETQPDNSFSLVDLKNKTLQVVAGITL